MAATAEEKVERPLLRTITGVVASDKGNKTIKVVVEYQQRHPKYGKYLRRRTVLHAHDEKNDAKEGEFVLLIARRQGDHLAILSATADPGAVEQAIRKSA